MNTTTELSAAGAALLGGILASMSVAAVIIGIVWYVLQVIAYWKIFSKAGKPGWHSLIPILNNWDEIDLSWSRKMAWTFFITVDRCRYCRQPDYQTAEPGIGSFRYAYRFEFSSGHC